MGESTKTRLAESIGLTPRQVNSWFSGRHSKDKKKWIERDKSIKLLESSRQELTEDDDSDHEGLRSRSDSGSGGKSDSNHSNVPLVHLYDTVLFLTHHSMIIIAK